MKKIVVLFLSILVLSCQTQEEKLKEANRIADAKAKEVFRLDSISKVKEVKRLRDLFVSDSLSVAKKIVKDKFMKEAKKKFRFETSEYNDYNTIYGKNSSRYEGYEIYISMRKDGSVYLVGSIRYKGDNWVFWDSVTFLIDGEATNIIPDSKPERDNSRYGVYETYSFFPKSSNKILNDIAGAKSVKMRFEGKRYDEIVLYKSQIKEVKEVLELYNELVELNL